jgi:probable rRNA maturation factor
MGIVPPDRYEIVFLNRTRQRLPLAFFRRVAKRSLASVGVRRASIAISFVGEETMRKLSWRYRRKRRATNVLSFSYGEEGGLLTADIVLCVPLLRREAKAWDRSVRAHCAMLLIHGILHVAGYTHARPSHAAVMENVERRIAERVGVRL